VLGDSFLSYGFPVPGPVLAKRIASLCRSSRRVASFAWDPNLVFLCVYGRSVRRVNPRSKDGFFLGQKMG
jgi:hypothetical protein